jgi:hypothetical protein
MTVSLGCNPMAVIKDGSGNITIGTSPDYPASRWMAVQGTMTAPRLAFPANCVRSGTSPLPEAICTYRQLSGKALSLGKHRTGR